MVRTIAIAGLVAAMLGCLPAHAQEPFPELDGAPGSRAAAQQAAKPAAPQKKAVQPAPQKPAQAASTDKLKADQVKLAQQAEAQKAEQARLALAAENLKAQQARLDARAAELAAEEKRLAQLRSDQESRLAELTRQRDEAAREAALRTERQSRTADLSGDDDAADAAYDPPGAAPEARRPIYARLDFDAAESSCTRAGEDAAWARNFNSARYDSAPRVFQDRGWELRGRMRLEDRRGYLLVDTVCEVDPDGKAQRFAFLR